ncbi:MAG: hypothetical protein ACREJ3_14880 [Polyangiaceae bacterium]
MRDLLLHCAREWKLVIVGDGAMHPAELLGGGRWYGSTDDASGDPMNGAAWMRMLCDHFDRSAWLNPDSPSYWTGGTAEALAGLFSMHHLTLDGLGEAVTHLSKGRTQSRR